MQISWYVDANTKNKKIGVSKLNKEKKKRKWEKNGWKTPLK